MLLPAPASSTSGQGTRLWQPNLWLTLSTEQFHIYVLYAYRFLGVLWYLCCVLQGTVEALAE